MMKNRQRDHVCKNGHDQSFDPRVVEKRFKKLQTTSFSQFRRTYLYTRILFLMLLVNLNKKFRKIFREVSRELFKYFFLLNIIKNKYF